MLRGMIRSEVQERVAIITIDNPPVNALPVAGWFQLAETLRAMGRDPDVRVVILRAEGKGFQAGVDIKELAADPTNAALVAVNRGCYEAFAAVYDCEVPVIAAVQGFCLGGGIALAGNADIVVAVRRRDLRGSRGRSGRAWVPQRTWPASCRSTSCGRCSSPVPRSPRANCSRSAPSSASCPGRTSSTVALEIAHEIAKKSSVVIRRAKESLNAIEPVDVKRSYRFEQGFTFELNLFGDSDELRQAFVDKRDAELPDRRET